MAQANRGLAFSLFYTVMNVGSLMTGLLLDFFRIQLPKGLNIAAFGPGTLLNSGLRLLLLVGTMPLWSSPQLLWTLDSPFDTR